VGTLQSLTIKRLLRPFPLGLRFSGNNMSPLPGWLCGAHGVCLNFSNNDLAVQLHFALFNDSSGFVLKPPEMLGSLLGPGEDVNRLKPDAYWPPARVELQLVTIRIISLHQLPKHGEQRLRLDGRHSACHDYHPELSGAAALPDKLSSSSPAIQLALNPVGGFCAISDTVIDSDRVETQFATQVIKGNGLNAPFAQTVHCMAAEPDSTFLRLSVTDSGKEVAYETAVLGRLRGGYRVVQLRGPLGTRIELAYVLVRISFDRRENVWPTRRQLRLENTQSRRKLMQLSQENAELRMSTTDFSRATSGDSLWQPNRGCSTESLGQPNGGCSTESLGQPSASEPSTPVRKVVLASLLQADTISSFRASDHVLCT